MSEMSAMFNIVMNDLNFRLCDKNGPSMCLEKREMGSVFNLAWSNDSTQVAGASALGHVVFGNVVDKKYQWKNYEAIISGLHRRNFDLPYC